MICLNVSLRTGGKVVKEPVIIESSSVADPHQERYEVIWIELVVRVRLLLRRQDAKVF